MRNIVKKIFRAIFPEIKPEPVRSLKQLPYKRGKLYNCELGNHLNKNGKCKHNCEGKSYLVAEKTKKTYISYVTDFFNDKVVHTNKGKPKRKNDQSFHYLNGQPKRANEYCKKTGELLSIKIFYSYGKIAMEERFEDGKPVEVSIYDLDLKQVKILDTSSDYNFNPRICRQILHTIKSKIENVEVVYEFTSMLDRIAYPNEKRTRINPFYTSFAGCLSNGKISEVPYEGREGDILYCQKVGNVHNFQFKDGKIHRKRWNAPKGYLESIFDEKGNVVIDSFAMDIDGRLNVYYTEGRPMFFRNTYPEVGEIDLGEFLQDIKDHVEILHLGGKSKNDVIILEKIKQIKQSLKVVAI